MANVEATMLLLKQPCPVNVHNLNELRCLAYKAKRFNRFYDAELASAAKRGYGRAVISLLRAKRYFPHANADSDPQDWWTSSEIEDLVESMGLQIRIEHVRGKGRSYVVSWPRSGKGAESSWATKLQDLELKARTFRAAKLRKGLYDNQLLPCAVRPKVPATAFVDIELLRPKAKDLDDRSLLPELERLCRSKREALPGQASADPTGMWDCHFTWGSASDIMGPDVDGLPMQERSSGIDLREKATGAGTDLQRRSCQTRNKIPVAAHGGIADAKDYMCWPVKSVPRPQCKSAAWLDEGLPFLEI